jgi:hypothetical protein
MAAQEKDEFQELRDRLTVSPTLVWDQVDAAERAAIMAYGEAYKDFLNRAKTERQAVDEIMRLLCLQRQNHRPGGQGPPAPHRGAAPGGLPHRLPPPGPEAVPPL